MTNNYLTGEKIKAYMLDPKVCAMCHYCFSAKMDGGYCPQYDCWATDKCKQLTDRQWDNIAKKLKFDPTENIDIDEIIEEVKKKRIRK